MSNVVQQKIPETPSRGRWQEVDSATLTLSCKGRTIATVHVDRHGKRNGKVVDTDGVLSVSVGMNRSARPHQFGAKLAALMEDILGRCWSTDVYSIKLIVDACCAYGDDLLDGCAPDRAFDVRAGSLMPMCRLPNAEDGVTIHMGSEKHWVNF